MHDAGDAGNSGDGEYDGNNAPACLSLTALGRRHNNQLASVCARLRPCSSQAALAFTPLRDAIVSLRGRCAVRRTINGSDIVKPRGLSAACGDDLSGVATKLSTIIRCNTVCVTDSLAAFAVDDFGTQVSRYMR
jgi:hypothetical protein